MPSPQLLQSFSVSPPLGSLVHGHLGLLLTYSVNLFLQMSGYTKRWYGDTVC